MYEEYISYLLNIIVIRISYAVKGIGHLQIYIQSYHILYIYVRVLVCLCDQYDFHALRITTVMYSNNETPWQIFQILKTASKVNNACSIL